MTQLEHTVERHRPASRHRALGEPGIVVAIFVMAFAIGRWYAPTYRAGGGVPFYYQEEFGPAVMLACGRGFVNPDHHDIPRLEAFLQQSVDSVRCGEIPSTTRIIRLDGLQGVTRYLMTAAALVWTVAGVSWRALDLLVAVFYATTVTAAYGIMRLACGRIAALFVTALWAFSPRHLENISHIRDYSKAPFFVLTLLAMWVVFDERRPWRLVLTGAVFGALQGLGFGMRTDVLINFLPFFGVLLLGGFDPVWARAKAKLTCAAATLVVFFVVALPTFATYSHFGSFWHVALLGLSGPNTDNLKLGSPPPAYRFPYAYNDGYIETVVRSHEALHHPDAPPVRMYSLAYDAACRAYYGRLFTRFPGDFATRMIASMLFTSNLPAFESVGPVPPGITAQWLVSLSMRRSRLVEVFKGFGPLLLVAALVVLGLERLRHAWLAFGILGTLLSYPFLEFQGRHLFHLEFLVLALAAWTAALAIKWARRVARGEVAKPKSRLLAAIATVAIQCAILVSALWIARAVQEPRAAALLDRYRTASTEPVRAIPAALPNGMVRLGVDLFSPTPPNGLDSAVVVADFQPATCAQARLADVVFRYQQDDPRFALDFSLPMRVAMPRAGDPPTRVLVPVYSLNRGDAGVTKFVGIDIPAATVDCVHVSRVRDLTALPMLLPAALTPDWRDRLYERLRFDTVLVHVN